MTHNLCVCVCVCECAVVIAVSTDWIRMRLESTINKPDWLYLWAKFCALMPLTMAILRLLIWQKALPYIVNSRYILYVTTSQWKMLLINFCRHDNLYLNFKFHNLVVGHWMKFGDDASWSWERMDHSCNTLNSENWSPCVWSAHEKHHFVGHVLH